MMIDTKTILNKAVAIILKYLESNLHPDTKVVNYQTANVLKEKLDLTLPDDGVKGTSKKTSISLWPVTIKRDKKII